MAIEDCICCHFTFDFSQGALVEDFRALRERLEAEGCFKTQPLFFILHLGHILLLEVIALMLVWYFGTGWINTAIVSVILATAQVLIKLCLKRAAELVTKICCALDAGVLN